MTRTSSLFISLAALALSSAALAGEVDTYCELSTARAAVQSELLKAPEAFGNLGDPATAARSLTVGVRKFISRGQQGELVTRLGQAECNAYKAQRDLAEQLTGVEARSEVKAIEAKRPLLLQALDLAEKNLATEKSMLAAQAATLADLKAAFDQRDRLRQDLATLDARLSMIRNQLPEAEMPLDALLNAAVAAQSEVTELTAKIQSRGGWEVSIAGGSRSDLQTGKNEGFIAVAATRSFGYGRATEAADRVGALTAKLLREQRDGSFQQLARTQDAVTGVIAAERMTAGSLSERRDAMQASLARLAGVNTTEGLRSQRALQVEIAATVASLQASVARAEHLTQWLGRNAAR